MEATGAYWKPLWNLLEDQFELLLAGARHVKAVPGRTTDLNDAEWQAQLLPPRLLRPSFVPDRAQRELHELTGSRTALVGERAAEAARLGEGAGGRQPQTRRRGQQRPGRLRGVSARQMLERLVAGDDDPAALAELARGRLRAKLPQLVRALTGRVAAHQRFLLAPSSWPTWTLLDEAIEHVSTRDRRAGRSGRGDHRPPGQHPRGRSAHRRDPARILVAELGTDMGRFPSAAHLAWWAGMCPGNDERAGKRRSGRTRPGSPWLCHALVEAAQAAGRTKATYLAAQYRRLATRRGKKQAVVAVGHTILVIAYHLLVRGRDDEDLGEAYFDQHDRAAVQPRLVRRLEALGYAVQLEPRIA